MPKINPKSYRFHPEIDKLIDTLAAHELTNRTAIIETAIKEMAKSRNITLKKETDTMQTEIVTVQINYRNGKILGLFEQVAPYEARKVADPFGAEFAQFLRDLDAQGKAMGYVDNGPHGGPAWNIVLADGGGYVEPDMTLPLTRSRFVEGK